jgi:hypothetical protein
MKKILLWTVISMLVLMSSSGCGVGKRSSAVEGKVINSQGKALSDVKVVATQQVPLKGFERIESKTKTDGTFVLKGLYPNANYNLSFEGGQCNDATLSLDSAPAGETKLLPRNILLQFSPFKKGNDGVVADPRTGLEWLKPPSAAMSWEDANSYAQTLSLAGGRWRVPTRKELLSLYESGQQGCGIERELFVNTVWTSDPIERDGGWQYAWHFELGSGKAEKNLHGPGMAFTFPILVVRSAK